MDYRIQGSRVNELALVGTLSLAAGKDQRGFVTYTLEA